MGKGYLGGAKRKRDESFSEFKRLDCLEGEAGLGRKEFESRDGIQLELANLWNMEESNWKQKAISKWIREGDNRNLFHSVRVIIEVSIM